MSVDSEIYMKEVVQNKNREFGSQLEYYPVNVDLGDKVVPALFTYDQISVAIERAARNSEDMPKKKSFLSFIFG